MKEFFRKYIYILLIISLIVNLTGVFFVARKIYRVSLYASNNHFISNRYISILNLDSIPPDEEIDKPNILNTLVDRFNYKSYLEIGQGRPENNFNWIKCKIRLGVDPDPRCNAAYCLPSDEFFEVNRSTFDLIFIDGLHQKDQVYRDIINSLNCLNENGTIVVHDCNPTDEAMQVVPPVQGVWTGDVWRAWLQLRSERDDLEMYVINTANGCGIIRIGKQNTITVPDNISYQSFSENREYLLNLKSINDFLRHIKGFE
jgi:hypothetical protein